MEITTIVPDALIKIGKLDMDYWKECSNIEFFNGMRKELEKFREDERRERRDLSS